MLEIGLIQDDGVELEQSPFARRSSRGPIIDTTEDPVLQLAVDDGTKEDHEPVEEADSKPEKAEQTFEHPQDSALLDTRLGRLVLNLSLILCPQDICLRTSARRRALEPSPEEEDVPPVEVEDEGGKKVFLPPPEDYAESCGSCFCLPSEDLRKRGITSQIPLYEYSQIPNYLKGNQFVQHGYRVNFSYSKIFRSLFHIHNETLNIWTHLFGFFFFIFLATFSLSTWLNGRPWVEVLFFMIWSTCSMVMMAFSSFFHLLCCHSWKVHRLCARLDYTGISFLIVGSYFPLLYYIFYCDISYMVGYLVAIGFLGSCGLAVSWLERFQAPQCLPVRAGLFVAIGLFGFVPIPNAIGVVGWDAMAPIAARALAMGLTYIGGAVIYALHLPERFFPGKFDLTFHSHVIWHIFVLVATFIHYITIVYCYEWRASQNFHCPAR